MFQPAAYPLGPGALALHRRAGVRVGRALRAGGLSPIWRAPRRGGWAAFDAFAVDGGSSFGWVVACRFLLISYAMPARRPDRARRVRAAPHNSIVKNNENTIAGARAGDRPYLASHWITGKKPTAAGECSAARGPKIQCDNNRTTIRNKTPGNFRRRRPASATGRACRSLLIPRLRPRPAMEPVRSGGSRADRHGQAPPRRPPSRPTESGGRP